MSKDFDVETGNIVIKKCANEGCEKRLDGAGISIPRETFSVECPHCGNPLYVTDTLRLHEAFSDHQGNDGLVSRTRNLFEHLLLLHYLIYLRDQSVYAPQHFAFVMDGALAIFGEGARFHRSLMRLVADVNDKASDSGLSGAVLFGVQKSGAVQEFARALDRSVPDSVNDSLAPYELAERRGGCIPKGTVLPISDELRFKYITPKSPSVQNEHGYDT
jgi:hypothetical protein